MVHDKELGMDVEETMRDNVWLGTTAAIAQLVKFYSITPESKRPTICYVQTLIFEQGYQEASSTPGLSWAPFVEHYVMRLLVQVRKRRPPFWFKLGVSLRISDLTVEVRGRCLSHLVVSVVQSSTAAR